VVEVLAEDSHTVTMPWCRKPVLSALQG